MKRRVLGVLLMFALVIPMSSFGQNYTELNWYFGNSNNAFIFDKSDLRIQIDSTQATPFGTGGDAVISDAVSGDLLFYTDGNNVYDINHNIVPNGTGLSGNATLNRAAVVYPLPYSAGLFYVFTNSGASGVNEIQYTIINRNSPGNATGITPPSGDVTSVNLPTGLTNPSDGMLMIRRNINDYWLISQDRLTFEYKVLAMNGGVLGAIQTFDLSTVTDPGFIAADFAYNEDSTKIAVAPKDQNRNVSILDFDITTGTLTFDRSIINTGNADLATEAIYGIEWSSTGAQLYISRHGGGGIVGNVYQYDLGDSLNTVNAILPQPVFRSYGLKRGPDQNIYHLYQATSTDPILIGVIQEADSTYKVDSVLFNVSYNPNGVAVNNINATQFPAFAGDYFENFLNVEFFVLDTCVTSATKFFSNVDPTPASYQWDFGDGNSSNAVSPIHQYDNSGTFPVTLTVTLNGVQDMFTRTVNIVDNDLNVDLGMDTVRCVGEVFTYDAGPNGLLYMWSTGEGTQTIEVDTTGVFSVTVLSSTGCLARDFVEVVTYRDESTFRNQWYFGEMAGIDFNDPVSAIVDANQINSPQASSAMSDLNGKLLFYTDGETVWNKEHNVMINGINIGGDNTSMQGAMIIPVPGDSSIYYIFTTNPVYGDYKYDLKYSVVDIRLDSARGIVVLKDMLFQSNSTERLSAFRLGQNGSFLITHEFGNNLFKSYPISVDGIGAPVTSSTGSVMRFDEQKTATGEMQIAQTGDLIALAFQDTNENFVEIYQVNDTTGYITVLAKIDIKEPVPSLVYGIEFSAAANKLYVTTNSNGSKLIQYDMDSVYAPTAKADIEATKFVISSDPSLDFGALQTGPNGIIYMAVDHQGTIGTISSPGLDDNAASFAVSGFDLNGRISRLGLPNFGQERPLTALQPGIEVDNLCLGADTEFLGTGTSTIDVFLWTFGDGTFANIEDTTHLYNLSGPYNVSLRVTNRCGLDTTFIKTIDINPIPDSPTLLDAVTLCNGPVTLEAWPVDTPDFTYTWSTGETTRQITVDKANFIAVYLTDSNGCRSDPRSSFVDDTRPIVDLGVDRNICQFSAIADLNANNPGSDYSWFLNGANNGNILGAQSIDTSLPGIFIYKVIVEDLFNCLATDSVTLVIQNSPLFDIVSTPTTGCGNNDGEIELTEKDISGSYIYSATGSTNVTNTTIPAGGVVDIAPLASGSYSVFVRNLLTGCITSKGTTVDDSGSGYLINSVNTTPGCPAEGEIDVVLSGTIPFNVNYTLNDTFGNLAASGVGSPSPTSFQINALDSGNYILTLVEQGGFKCTQSTSFTLAGLPLARYASQAQFICDDEGKIGILPITVDVTNPISYTWTGPAIIGSAINDSINVAQSGIYTVTSNGIGYCPITQNVNVSQNISPTVSIDIVGNECDGLVTLVANPSGLVGRAGYLWDNGLRNSRRVVRDTDTYSVTLLDQGSGCFSTSSLDVQVFDEITVFTIAEPNCDANGEVFLKAYANITEDVMFSWTGPGGALSETDAEISIGTSGNYTVIVKSNSNICQATSSINTMVLPITEDQLLLSPNETFCSIDPDPTRNVAILDPGAFSSYEWVIVNTSEILSMERIFTTNEANVYQVNVTNGFACVKDFVEVRDDCEPVIYAPTGFTPNSDGTNDTFFVYENPYVDNFNIKIFSRWGEIIYNSSDINFKWAGVWGNQALPAGTYVYIMTFKSLLKPERGTVVQRGGVTLIR